MLSAMALETAAEAGWPLGDQARRSTVFFFQNNSALGPGGGCDWCGGEAMFYRE